MRWEYYDWWVNNLSAYNYMWYIFHFHGLFPENTYFLLLTFTLDVGVEVFTANVNTDGLLGCIFNPEDRDSIIL